MWERVNQSVTHYKFLRKNKNSIKQLISNFSEKFSKILKQAKKNFQNFLRFFKAKKNFFFRSDNFFKIFSGIFRCSQKWRGGQKSFFEQFLYCIFYTIFIKKHLILQLWSTLAQQQWTVGGEVIYFLRGRREKKYSSNACRHFFFSKKISNFFQKNFLIFFRKIFKFFPKKK